MDFPGEFDQWGSPPALPKVTPPARWQPDWLLLVPLVSSRV